MPEVSALLSEEKQTHLAHVILAALKTSPIGSLGGDTPLVLKEIKRVIVDQLQEEHTLDQLVRTRLRSYSRSIPEGSQEWDVLYQKTYAEELRKKHLA
jgi:hypothetical protein